MRTRFAVLLASLATVLTLAATDAGAIQAKIRPGPGGPGFGNMGQFGSMGRIISDVDLYDWPGGVGRVIGILREGQIVPVSFCRKDNWCHLARTGWVWGDFVARGR